MAPATPAVEPDTSARPDDPAAHLAADEPTIQALRRGSRARPSDSPCRRRAWHDPPSTLPRTSRGGITTGVLAEDGVRLPFRHDLIRDAIYGDVALAAEAARPVTGLVHGRATEPARWRMSPDPGRRRMGRPDRVDDKGDPCGAVARRCARDAAIGTNHGLASGSARCSETGVPPTTASGPRKPPVPVQRRSPVA
jgi:hypothetical protein